MVEEVEVDGGEGQLRRCEWTKMIEGVDEEESEEVKGRLGKLIPWRPSLPSKPRIAILRHICTLETNAH